MISVQSPGDVALLLDPQPINKYSDEPHPDDEWAWKRWWVKKCYDSGKPLLRQDLVFIHNCWRETKARWCF